jgi:hypothetical protein
LAAPNSVDGNGIAVYVDSTGQLGTTASSLRFKEQVRDIGDSTNGLMKLRPVTFLYKPEYDKGERTLQYGLIAEEVAKAGDTARSRLKRRPEVPVGRAIELRKADGSGCRLPSEMEEGNTAAALNASGCPVLRKRLEARMESLFSFPVGLFHPLQHAGSSRRTPDCRQPRQSWLWQAESECSTEPFAAIFIEA